MDFVVYVLLIF